MVKEQHNDTADDDEQHCSVSEVFYRYVSVQTSQMIEQMAREDYEQLGGDDIPEEESELIEEEIQLKTESFLSLINSVKSKAFTFNIESFKKLDKTT